MFTELDFVSVISGIDPLHYTAAELTSVHADIGALHYFRIEYLANPDRRTALLTKVLRYLAHKHFSSREHFAEWCRELENVSRRDPIHCGLIIYGLRTLILQNFRRRDLTDIIYPAVDRLTSTLRASNAQTPPDSMQRAWVQEMVDPDSGLTSTLRTWNEFNQRVVASEKTLQQLRQAIDQDQPDLVRRQLRTIEEIFSKPPPMNLSAHSRIAAIASLFHAMSMSAWEVQRDAFSTADKIVHAENFFMFSYEERLLKKLLSDYLQPHPLNGNVETRLSTPHQPEHSAEEEAHRGDETPPASLLSLPFDFAVHPR